MSLLWSDQLVIKLTPDSVSIAKTSYSVVRKKKTEIVSYLKSEPNQDIVSLLGSALDKLDSKRASATVSLSDAFCTYFLLPETKQWLTHDELERLTLLSMKRKLGDIAAEKEFVIDRLRYNEKTLVAATDRSLLKRLSNLLDDKGIKTYAIVPAFIGFIHQNTRFPQPENRWVVFIQPESLSVGYWCKGRLLYIHQEPSQNEETFLRLTLKRLQQMVKSDASVDAAVQVGGQYQKYQLTESMRLEGSQKKSALEFFTSSIPLLKRYPLSFQRQSGMMRLRWGSFILSLTLCASVVIYTYWLTERLDAEQLALNELTATLKQAKISAPTPIDPEHKATLDRLEKVRTALQIDWPLLFKALETSKGADIFLTEIAPDSNKKSMLLAGEADTLDQVFLYLDRLNQTLPFVKARLVDHQQSKKDQKAIVHFEIQTEWN